VAEKLLNPGCRGQIRITPSEETMHPDQIKVGTCYRTARNEVRSVIDITAEKRVIYKARNSSYAKGDAGWYQNTNASTIPMLNTFAHAVVGEVPCDWDSATTPTPEPSVAGIKHGTAGQTPAADAPKKPAPDLGPP
jgi:hypothetical protein